MNQDDPSMISNYTLVNVFPILNKIGLGISLVVSSALSPISNIATSVMSNLAPAAPAVAPTSAPATFGVHPLCL